MEPTNDPHLFPDTFYTASLNSWASAIQRPHSEAQFCFIDLVVHYKAQSSMEHEFLVVYAIHRSGALIVLGVDRNAERPSVALGGAASVGVTSTASSMSLPGPSTSSSFSGSSSCEAYDSVQVSHDGTPTPILAQYGPTVELSRITFARTVAARSNDEADPRRPSLRHLCVLLLTIRRYFPSYSLLQYQCYFFARATCLALIDLFDGKESPAKEGQRATWCGVHVPSFSTRHKVVYNVSLYSGALVILLAATTPGAGLGLAGLKALYGAEVLSACGGALYVWGGELVTSKVGRQRISDEKIRKHGIPHKYRAAWQA